MKWIDTHAHLYLEEFSGDRAHVMQNALANSVEKIFLPNIDQSTIHDMLQLETDYPAQCFAMMGLHPCSVKENAENELEAIREWLNTRTFSAVGEIGLDYHWDITYKEQQLYAFRTQIDLAKIHRLPIVIHSRDSTSDCIRIVKEKQDGHLKGIFHCFSGSVNEAREIIELGFLLGIGGVVTFKKSGLDEVIKTIGLEHIVLETDAPYLAPVPYRGKRNESSYIPLIAEKIASIKEVPIEKVAEETTRQALALFEK